MKLIWVSIILTHGVFWNIVNFNFLILYVNTEVIGKHRETIIILLLIIIIVHNNKLLSGYFGVYFFLCSIFTCHFSFNCPSKGLSNTVISISTKSLTLNPPGQRSPAFSLFATTLRDSFTVRTQFSTCSHSSTHSFLILENHLQNFFWAIPQEVPVFCL